MFKKITITIVMAELCAFLRRFFFRLYAGGHGTLKHQSTQSVLLFQLGSFAHSLGTIKRQTARAWSREERDRLGSFQHTSRFAVLFLPLLGKIGRSNGDSAVSGNLNFLKETVHLSVIAKLCFRKLKACCLAMVWSILFLCIFQLQAQAQNQTTTVAKQAITNSLPTGEGWGGAFKVGDKLPESFWKQEHRFYQNGKTFNQTLETYKGKLLILDFWAGWCSSCLKKWPLLDSMQKQYPKELQVVLVNEQRNGDNLAKVKLKLDAFKNGAHVLTTIYADSLLGAQFPHQILPHYIWISAKGELMAITAGAFTSREIIERMLDEQRARKNRQTK